MLCVFVTFVNILDLEGMNLFWFLKHMNVLMSPCICHMICSVHMSWVTCTVWLCINRSMCKV